MAIQAFGGGGFADTVLTMPISMRAPRVADGPDEVYADQLARSVLGRYGHGDGASSGGSVAIMVAQGADYELQREPELVPL